MEADFHMLITYIRYSILVLHAMGSRQRSAVVAS